MMRKRCLSAVIFGCTIGLTALTGNALAEFDEMSRNQEKLDVGVRYPGDTAFKEGTIRTSGPEKGPYVERCTWGFKPTGKGFGLTQTCRRYTLENTK